MDGKRRDLQTAKATAKDVSKYLFFVVFCNEEKVEWSSFLHKGSVG